MIEYGLGLLAKLEALLDKPTIPWKTLVIGFTLAQFTFERYLALRQYKKLESTKIPNALIGVIDQETFDKSQAYGRAKARFGFLTSIYGLLQNLVILGFDLLPALWYSSGSLVQYFPYAFQGQILNSILFVFIFSMITMVLNLPTSLYSTFVLEESFGFNKNTIGLFFKDIVMSIGLGIVIGTPVLYAFLKIIDYFGQSFFVYLWLFFLAFQFIMITIYPIFIQPLFNKLEPLPAGKLRTEVESLAASLQFPLKHLYVIDGSKRSAHSNAYFFGLPWAKHIVLFDTLIEQSSIEQVVAVLAHELGHWKLSHTSRLLAISQVQIFTTFALFSAFIANSSVYVSFGFPVGVKPILVGFLLYNDILTPLDSVVTLLMNMLSRRHEYQADEFAKKLEKSEDLAEALIKLQTSNLGTMDPDSWFSAYHHSHPTLTERLKAIGFKGKKI